MSVAHAATLMRMLYAPRLVPFQLLNCLLRHNSVEGGALAPLFEIRRVAGLSGWQRTVGRVIVQFKTVFESSDGIEEVIIPHMCLTSLRSLGNGESRHLRDA